MSQFDYTSNIMQPALDAVVTLNSGSTEPPTTAPFMLWMDTSATPAVLKQRNGDDTGWDVLFMATNVVFDDGLAQIQASNVQEAIEKIKALIDVHAGRTDNPHQVTAEQVGAAQQGHEHTLADITDAGEAAAMDRATEAMVEEGIDNNTVVTPVLMKKAVHTFSSRYTQLITEDCDFVVPAEKIWVEITAGGGGGGGAYNPTSHRSGSGSGGSGGSCMVEIDGLEVGSVIACTVGKAGVGGKNPAYPNDPPNAGTPGGDSSFGDYVVCTGGKVGQSVKSGYGPGGACGNVAVKDVPNVKLLKSLYENGNAGQAGGALGGKSIFGCAYGAGGDGRYFDYYISRAGFYGRPGAILVSW